MPSLPRTSEDMREEQYFGRRVGGLTVPRLHRDGEAVAEFLHVVFHHPC